MASKDKTPEPMDPSITESKVGIVRPNTKRNAYALVQLVDEVRHLFPETYYEFGNYNGRNTALGVTFFDAGESLARILLLTKNESRVSEVMAYADGDVYVALHNNARTMDSREKWGLADAYEILEEGESW